MSPLNTTSPKNSFKKALHSDFDSKLTNVLNKEVVLIIEGGLIPRAELDTVIDPDGRVVLIEEALVWLISAVMWTLPPLIGKGLSRSVSSGKTTRGQAGGNRKQLFILFCLICLNILDTGTPCGIFIAVDYN